jgi:hypothetical protein
MSLTAMATRPASPALKTVSAAREYAVAGVSVSFTTGQSRVSADDLVPTPEGPAAGAMAVPRWRFARLRAPRLARRNGSVPLPRTVRSEV